MVKRFLLILILICGALAASARDTRQGVLNPAFRSLKAEIEGQPLSLPIIDLNGNDRVVISFDELADDRRYMRYELIHCDADWRPDDLVDSEYLDGFNQADVDDYAFSEATLAHYVHYRITLPNDQMRFTVSGNYLVRVYPEDNPDETLLQARFMVNERLVNIRGDVTSRTDIDTNRSHQQVEFSVNVGDYPVEDLYSDLRVVVEQDNRQDNKVTVSRPLRLESKTAVFEHLRPLIFDAGNEYRRFETVSTSVPCMRLYTVTYHDPYYHAVIETDYPREQYSYDMTQNGRYLVREYNSDESDVQADYIETHFTLDMPERPGYDIYIEGDLTDRRLDDGSRMAFNRETLRYEKTLFLKQGSYNYQYLAVPKGTDQAQTALVEGNFYPTIHEYTVYVYHRPRGSRYDRLLGIATLRSGR